MPFCAFMGSCFLSGFCSNEQALMIRHMCMHTCHAHALHMSCTSCTCHAHALHMSHALHTSPVFHLQCCSKHSHFPVLSRVLVSLAALGWHMLRVPPGCHEPRKEEMLGTAHSCRTMLNKGGHYSDCKHGCY